MAPRHLCAAFIEDDAAEGDRIEPSACMRPAWGEFARRAAALPGLALQVARQATLGGRSLWSAAERLGRALPTGLYSHAPIEAQMRMCSANRAAATNSAS
jgi:hypothetical protein